MATHSAHLKVKTALRELRDWLELRTWQNYEDQGKLIERNRGSAKVFYTMGLLGGYMLEVRATDNPDEFQVLIAAVEWDSVVPDRIVWDRSDWRAGPFENFMRDFRERFTKLTLNTDLDGFRQTLRYFGLKHGHMGVLLSGERDRDANGWPVSTVPMLTPGGGRVDFTVRPTRSGHIEVTPKWIRGDDLAEAQAFYRELEAELVELSSDEIPPAPQPHEYNRAGDFWDAFFVWFHTHAEPVGLSLKEASESIPRMYSTVKKEHSLRCLCEK